MLVLNLILQTLYIFNPIMGLFVTAPLHEIQLRSQIFVPNMPSSE